MQVCLVNAIKLADLIDGFGVGVPYIDAREQACDCSCDAVQCIPRLPDRLADLSQARLPAGTRGRGTVAEAHLIAKMNDPEPTLNMTERMGVARAPPVPSPASR